MYYFVHEHTCRNSTKGKQVISGLSQELRKKRKRLLFSESASVPKTGDVAFVLGVTIEWIDQTLKTLNEKKITPVLLLSNGSEFVGRSCYSVYFDEKSFMQSVMREVQYKCGEQVAVFGIDLRRFGDRLKREAAIECGAQAEAIYYNNGSISQCYKAFYSEKFRYQAIIAANGAAAVYLANNLSEEDKKRIQVFSYVDSPIFRFKKNGIIVVDYDYSEVGTLGFFVSERAQKDTRVGDVVIKARWAIDNNAVPQTPVGPILRISQTELKGEDEDLVRIQRLERYLNVMDEIDEQIIRSLIQKKTNDVICEQTFLTMSAVKYRIKKMEQLCGCSGKTELTALLTDYLKNE